MSNSVSKDTPENISVGTSSDNLILQLETAKAKAQESQNQWLRARAEIENLQKRQARELENAHKFALDNFVRELLQVWDSLELGHTASQNPEADVTKLREGTELTLKLFIDIMSKFGVQSIDPKGEPFDPKYHQAMSMQVCDDIEPNHVVSVIQKGYTLNNRLVRPALVMVSKATDAES
ncbi:molecular chaperone GrpE [Achromatium sp. WMS3]|nr:molecular chaperone GrpE [Achromatium sp. WMS3]